MNKKVNIIALFSDAIKFTLAHYKGMLGIIIPQLCIGLLLLGLQEAMLLFQENLGVLMLVNMLVMIASIVSIYFISRLHVSLITYIADRHINKDHSLNAWDTYEKAGGRTWQYIGVSLLIGLIFLIPAVFAFVSIMVIMFAEVYVIPIIFIVVSLISMIVIMAKFMLGMYATVIEPALSSYISYGSYLSKGFMGTILIVLFAMELLTIPLQIPNLLATYQVIEMTMFVTVCKWSAIILPVFVNPFITAAMIILYDKIIRVKMESQEFYVWHPFLKQSVDKP